MKTLIVGDIHGCWTEFQMLLDKAALGADDRIVSVGDMIDRGPESPRVLDFFRTTPNASAIMGNREYKHLRSWRGESIPAKTQIITRTQFSDEGYAEALDYIATLPAYLQLPEVDMVHAFFEPGVPLTEQTEGVIIGTNSGENYLQERLEHPWYASYDGDKPLVVGHRNYLGLSRPMLYPPDAPRIYALDTSCVYGGALTGLLLPDFEIITVMSRANYWEALQQEYDWIDDS